jgi:hypothetical protein
MDEVPFASGRPWDLAAGGGYPPCGGTADSRITSSTGSTSVRAGTLLAPDTIFGFLGTITTLAVIVLYIMANIALTAYIRREHASDYSRWRHLVLPGVGTLALLPDAARLSLTQQPFPGLARSPNPRDHRAGASACPRQRITFAIGHPDMGEHLSGAGNAPPASSHTKNPAGPGDTRPGNRRRKRTPVILLVIFLVLGGLAAWLFQLASPGEQPTPPYATITLSSNDAIGIISYSVQLSPGHGELTVGVQLSSAPSQFFGTPDVTLRVSRPNSTAFQKCPTLQCAHILSSAELTHSSSLQRLLFSKNKSTASIHLPISDSGRSYTYNGVTASAAIPQVFYTGPGNPILETEYNIPSGLSYDWSVLPAGYSTSKGYPWWDEQVTGNETPAVAPADVDHARQTRDNWLTFLAGALVGVAGGVLVAATQEALRARGSPADT